LRSSEGSSLALPRTLKANRDAGSQSFRSQVHLNTGS
jgi:hypothetical protein